jgi:ethanolamine utilization microcompartment shell protein EutS
MKKQIFTIILLLMGGVSTFGQFKLDGGVSSLRLQTGGIDRMYIQPAGINANTGSIGINTITPDAKLTINGDMSFKNITRFTVNGGYTATNRNGASVLIFEAGGVLNGIAGGVDGMLLYVLCGYKMPTTITNGALLIKHEESTFESVPANRIMTHTGADFNIPTGTGGVMMVYDGGRQRWRIMEVTSGSGSFSGWGLTGNSGSNPTTDFIGTTDAQPMTFKTNNVERMRILSGGNIGIGTTVPDTKLHIYNASAGSVTALTNTIATIENSTNAYLSILTPATTVGAILFGSPTSNVRGYLAYNHATDKMSFAINGAERMTIDGAGNMGIGASTPTAKLEVAGSFAISGKASMTSNQNNFNLGGKSVIKVSGGGPFTLTGISGGVDGMIVHIYVTQSTDLIIAEDSGSSSAGNRIETGSNFDIAISQGGGVTLMYDGDAAYWRVIGFKQ